MTSVKLNKEMESTFNEKALTEETCPLMHDSKNRFVCLERLFGTMEKGMAFGDSAMSLDNKKKFYDAIALTEVWVL
jgi:hypothetical protein